MHEWAKCFLAALIVLPAQAMAIEWELFLSNRFYAESIPEDVLDAQLRVLDPNSALSERIAYQLHAVGAIRGRPTDMLGLELGLDTGLFELNKDGAFADGQPIADRARETLFLGETLIDLQFGTTGVLEIRAGKIRPRIGAGAIFDTYAFGLTADWDYGLVDRELPWNLRLHALLPDATFTAQSKQSPLFAAELAYAFERGTEVRIFGATFIDTENGLTPVLADAVFRGRLNGALDRANEIFPGDRPRLRNLIATRVSDGYRSRMIGYEVESEGTLGWLGATAKAKGEDFELSGALIFGVGSMRMNTRPKPGLVTVVSDIRKEFPVIGGIIEPVLLPPSTSDVALFSYFADVIAKYHLTPEYSVDVFGILMSGDRGLSEDPAAQQDRYTSFVALAPLLPFTAIFFRGGVASSLASPSVASVAPDGAGLGGAGVGAEMMFTDALTTRVSGAALVSTVPSKNTGSSFYGIEGDLEIDLQVTDFLAFSAQAAVFRPGRYFGDLPVGYQLIAAAHLLLP